VARKRMYYNIGGVLEQTLRRMHLDTRVRQYRVWEVWDRAVGETVARHSQPSRVRRGILYVTCVSSVWVQQLQFMKGVILETLNRQLGKGLLKDIRFYVGVLESPSAHAVVPSGPEPPLDEGERQWMDEVASPVNDPELQEIVKRVIEKDLRAKKTWDIPT